MATLLRRIASDDLSCCPRPGLDRMGRGRAWRQDPQFCICGALWAAPAMIGWGLALAQPKSVAVIYAGRQADRLGRACDNRHPQKPRQSCGHRFRPKLRLWRDATEPHRKSGVDLISVAGACGISRLSRSVLRVVGGALAGRLKRLARGSSPCVHCRRRAAARAAAARWSRVNKLVPRSIGSNS